MAAQRRELQMHKKLLFDTIQRQAGTLEKAILEGVMNAIEAQATTVQINFHEDKDTKILTIIDDGYGIQTLRDIESFWETFGTPHDESENKVWAQFRMGRGQLFSFGRNIWRTGKFKMVVDIDKWGLEYELHTDEIPYNGCTIQVELYNKNWSWGTSIKALKESVTKQVEFIGPAKVFFNDEQINLPPQDLKWTHEDENAYYLFGTGNDLSIYNLGAFVLSEQLWKAGVAGVVVSKKQLKVNFARNDIQSDCEIYSQIREVVKANRTKKSRNRKASLTTQERIATLCDIRDGGIDWKEVGQTALVETSSHRAMSLMDIRRMKAFWTFAPSYDQMSDKLMQSNQAICFDRDIMKQLDYRGEEKDFFSWLMDFDHDEERNYFNRKQYNEAKKWEHLPKLYRDFRSLTANIDNRHIVLPDTELTKTEKRLLRILRRYDRHWEGREIMIGSSETYNAWTDGNTYICLARQFLSRNQCGQSHHAAVKVVCVLCHEMSHDEKTNCTHVHGEEFYRRYHDLTLGRDSYFSPLYIAIDLRKQMKYEAVEDSMQAERKRQERAEKQKKKTLTKKKRRKKAKAASNA